MAPRWPLPCAADHPDVEAVYLAVYKNFMEAIDAIDNGACSSQPNRSRSAETQAECSTRVRLGAAPASLRPVDRGARAAPDLVSQATALPARRVRAPVLLRCRGEPVGERRASQVCQQHAPLCARGPPQPRLEPGRFW